MRPLFESPPGPLLMPDLGSLLRCGTHQTISGRLEQVYLSSDPRLEWPGEGPLSKQNFKQSTGKVLQNADVKACLSDLHNKYVFVPADKAPNNIIIICKRYYIETLIKELELDNCSTPTGNSTCTSCHMSFEDIVNTHDTFMKSLGIELSDDDKRLPYLYWTLMLHKSLLKHWFIAGSSKCTPKQLSSLLTKILTVIKA